jgi:hypothetical protein
MVESSNPGVGAAKAAAPRSERVPLAAACHPSWVAELLDQACEWLIVEDLRSEHFVIVG